MCSLYTQQEKQATVLTRREVYLITLYQLQCFTHLFRNKNLKKTCYPFLFDFTNSVSYYSVSSLRTIVLLEVQHEDKEEYGVLVK